MMQFVVVRSRIQHLGAEIRLVEDLLDDGGGGGGGWNLLGELGLMFTTLKVSLDFFKILVVFPLVCKSTAPLIFQLLNKYL